MCVGSKNYRVELSGFWEVDLVDWPYRVEGRGWLDQKDQVGRLLRSDMGERGWEIPPHDHAIFTASHQSVLPVLEVFFALPHVERLNLGQNRVLLVSRLNFELLRYKVILILDLRVHEVIIELNRAYKSSVANSPVHWLEIVQNGVYDKWIIFIPHSQDVTLLSKRWYMT